MGTSPLCYIQVPPGYCPITVFRRKAAFYCHTVRPLHGTLRHPQYKRSKNTILKLYNFSELNKYYHEAKLIPAVIWLICIFTGFATRNYPLTYCRYINGCPSIESQAGRYGYGRYGDKALPTEGKKVSCRQKESVKVVDSCRIIFRKHGLILSEMFGLWKGARISKINIS